MRLTQLVTQNLLFLGFNLIQPSPHNGIIMSAKVHILKICVAQNRVWAHRSHPTKALWFSSGSCSCSDLCDHGQILVSCAVPTPFTVSLDELWASSLNTGFVANETQLFTPDSKYQRQEVAGPFRVVIINCDHLTQQEAIRNYISVGVWAFSSCSFSSIAQFTGANGQGLCSSLAVLKVLKL